MSRFGQVYVISFICALLAAPIVLWGAFQALQIQVDDLATWVKPGFPVRVDYENFTSQFQNGDEIVASWPGCTVDDERLEEFVTMLESSADFRDASGQPYFEQVTSGQRILNKLLDDPLNLPRTEAVNRLRGNLIGEDGVSTCAVITFSKLGVVHRMKIVPRLREVMASRLSVPLDDQRLAGPVIDGHDVAKASDESMQQFGAISTIVILISCWWCLRSWRVALLVFVLSMYCEAATLALVYFCGEHMTPLMIIMPPLVLVVSVSGGVHLVNYLFDAMLSGDPATVPHRAFAAGWLPCVLSSGTTAIGLASLMVSDLKPIRDFGLYSSIGVTGTLIALFLFVPGAFEVWMRRRLIQFAVHRVAPQQDHAVALAVEQSGVGAAEAIESQATRAEYFLRRVARWLGENHVAVTLVSTIAMVAGAWGSQFISPSVRIEMLFPTNSRILKDYAWLEKQIGPLVPIEVLVRFDADSHLTMVERVQFVRRVQSELKKLPQVGGVISAASFLPHIGTDGSIKSIAARTVANKKLDRARADLQRLKMLSEVNGVQTWRVTARVSALHDMDYGAFLDVVRETTTPLVSAANEKDSHVSVAATGVMPLVHEIQRELLRVLFGSFMSATVIITIVMMFTERGVVSGIVAMIPNVFPMLIVFGFLGAMHVAMDIGSVMTASVALGMAIDGTLHYLTFFRRGVSRGETALEAIQSAYVHCAPAMTQSSVICGLGLAMFAGSSFLPTNRFAWMMVALIFFAMIGDIVLLPALLAGPCGRLFVPRRTSLPSDQQP